MLPATKPRPYSTWRHKKTGSLYVVLGVGMQSTNDRLPEEAVIYVSLDYQALRYRELNEFMDGRFEQVQGK